MFDQIFFLCPPISDFFCCTDCNKINMQLWRENILFTFKQLKSICEKSLSDNRKHTLVTLFGGIFLVKRHAQFVTLYEFQQSCSLRDCLSYPGITKKISLEIILTDTETNIIYIIIYISILTGAFTY